MDNEHKEENGHGSHADHEHGEEDVIVLHQEKLFPTILMAAALVILTLFGLAQAGNTKLDISTGQTAFDKVENEKPKNHDIVRPTGQNMSTEPKQGKDEHKQEPVETTVH